LNFIPEAGFIAQKLIKSYFNLYSFKLERRLRKLRLLRRLRKYSSHKIYVSNGEFKHTNNNVIITLYIYNKQGHNQIFKLNKRFLEAFKLLKKKFKNRFKLIKYKGLNYVIKSRKKQNLIIKVLNRKHTIKKYKSLYSKYYIYKFYKKFLKKSLIRLKIYLYYKQLLFINKSKFKYTYLQNLKNYLEKIYNKSVEFNLVNLKKFYLNSEILSESITLKITRNRRKLLRYLRFLLRNVNIKKISYFMSSKRNRFLRKNLFNIKKILEKKRDKNYSSRYLRKIVLDSIKYKYLSGVRLEANGRLTRRYTASRSISKLRYKGNLINIDSSIKGLSSVVLRNNLRSNIQYTKLNSKTRIGSFGIKG
jgi:hypothetical protein